MDRKLCSSKLPKFKSDLATFNFTDNTSSCLSTSTNLLSKEHIEQKETKSIDIPNFQNFLKSKKTAFHFSPVFGTIKDINILNASTIQEDDQQSPSKQSNSNSKSSPSFLFSISPDHIIDCKNSFHLHSNRTESLYDENLLSSCFYSHIDD